MTIINPIVVGKQETVIHGKRFASGAMAQQQLPVVPFVYSNGATKTMLPLEVKQELGFIPSVIIAHAYEGYEQGMIVVYNKDGFINNKHQIHLSMTKLNVGESEQILTYGFTMDGVSAYANDHGFRLPIYLTRVWYWYAYE